MLTNHLFQANRQNPSYSSAKMSTPTDKALRKFEHKINLGEYICLVYRKIFFFEKADAVYSVMFLDWVCLL